MYRALKTDDFPTIRFTLGEVQPLDLPTSGRQRLRITGALTIAGVTRSVELTTDSRRSEHGTVQATGAATLLMTDFGIVPPKAIMGLIQADDRIEIHFNLVAAPEHPNSTDGR